VKSSRRDETGDDETGDDDETGTKPGTDGTPKFYSQKDLIGAT
jgi:hypothetical protein